MRNIRTHYNLKAVFFFLSFFSNFGHPFAVTACTHSNMSLKSGGGGLQPPPIPTPLHNLCLLATMNKRSFYDTTT